MAGQAQTNRRVAYLGVALLWLGAALAARPVLAESAPQSVMGGSLANLKHYAQGKQVYEAHCSGCHDAGIGRAPLRVALRALRPDAIYKILTEGVMRPMARGLSDADRRAVAEFLAEREMSAASAAPPANMCPPARAAFDRDAPPAFPGWGLDAANGRAIPAGQAGIRPADVPRLKLKWAFGFDGASRVRSQPSLAGGAIFVGSQDGYIHALDRLTGCERWRFEAKGEVRTAVVVQPWRKGDGAANPLAFFADQIGTVYAIRAFTGELVWSKRIDTHGAAVVTATPALYDGVLYVPVSSVEEAAAADPAYNCCTFRGSLVALDAATGEERWRTYTVGKPQPRGTKDGRQSAGPSGVAIWNTPAIDPVRKRIYVATGDNYSGPTTPLSDSILALDMATGAIVWNYQATSGDAWNAACYFRTGNCPDDAGPDFDFGAQTILAHGPDGRDLVLAGQKSGIAYGVDADTGTLAWEQRLGRGGISGGVLFSIASAEGRLFVPISDTGQNAAATYPASPGLHALDAASGRRLWDAPAANTCAKGRTDCDPGISGAITTTGELVFAGADDGHFRIYSAATGKVLRDFALERPFTTVNGVAASGGSMSGGSGAIADHGQLILTSGYGHAFKMAGNVLLVYAAR